MSLRAAKRNARRSINYNLPSPLAGASGVTLGEMLRVGERVIADLGRPELDDDRILIEGPENHNDIDFGG